MKFIKHSAILILPAILLLSCSSIPKGERLAAVNDKKEQAALFLSRGHNEYGWNNYESSIKLYSNAFSLSSSVDWEEGMIRSLVHMSRSSDRTADSKQSQVYLDAARELLFISDKVTLNILVGNRESEWLLFHKSPEKALEKCNEIINILGSENSEEAGETWRLKAAILKKMKNYDDALDAIEKAVTLDDKQHYIAELASDHYIKASILSLSGREVEGINSMLQALHYDKFIENTAGIAQDLYALALIYEKMGKKENANHFFQRTYLVYTGAGRSDIPPVLNEKLINASKSPLLFQETDAF
jgi:tetratricopeptide (TPR) repeat protein